MNESMTKEEQGYKCRTHGSGWNQIQIVREFSNNRDRIAVDALRADARLSGGWWELQLSPLGNLSLDGGEVTAVRLP